MGPWVKHSKLMYPQLEINWKTSCFPQDICVFTFCTATPWNNIFLAMTSASLHIRDQDSAFEIRDYLKTTHNYAQGYFA